MRMEDVEGAFEVTGMALDAVDALDTTLMVVDVFVDDGFELDADEDDGE